MYNMDPNAAVPDGNGKWRPFPLEGNWIKVSTPGFCTKFPKIVSLWLSIARLIVSSKNEADFDINSISIIARCDWVCHLRLWWRLSVLLVNLTLNIFSIAKHWMEKLILYIHWYFCATNKICWKDWFHVFHW